MSKLRSMFGQRIRSIRKSQKISQEVLAERCGLHYTYIGAVERGECNLSFDNIEKIAGALGVGMGDLLLLPEAREVLTEEEALQSDILSLLSGRSGDEIRICMKVIKDTMGWLRTEPLTKKRRRRTAAQ